MRRAACFLCPHVKIKKLIFGQVSVQVSVISHWRPTLTLCCWKKESSVKGRPGWWVWESPSTFRWLLPPNGGEIWSEDSSPALAPAWSTWLHRAGNPNLRGWCRPQPRHMRRISQDEDEAGMGRGESFMLRAPPWLIGSLASSLQVEYAPLVPGNKQEKNWRVTGVPGWKGGETGVTS